MPSMYSGNNIMDQIQGFLSLIPGTKQNKDWRQTEDLNRAGAIEQAKMQRDLAAQQNDVMARAKNDPKYNEALNKAYAGWLQNEFMGKQTEGLGIANRTAGRNQAAAEEQNQPSFDWMRHGDQQSLGARQVDVQEKGNQTSFASSLMPYLQDQPTFDADGKMTGTTPNPVRNQLIERFLGIAAQPAGPMDDLGIGDALKAFRGGGDTPQAPQAPGPAAQPAQMPGQQGQWGGILPPVGRAIKGAGGMAADLVGPGLSDVKTTLVGGDYGPEKAGLLSLEDMIALITNYIQGNPVK